MQDEEGGGFGEGFFFSPEFGLDFFEFGAVLSLAFFEFGGSLLVPVVGVLTGGLPALDLFGVEAVGSAELGDLGLVHGGGLQNGVEFVGGVPAVRGVVTRGHEDALFAGLTPPSVEGGQADAFLLGELWKRGMVSHLGNDGVLTFFWVVFHEALAPPAALVGKPPVAAGGAN